MVDDFVFSNAEAAYHLQTADYRQHNPNVSIKGEWHLALFQKRFGHPTGTAYYINIDQFNRNFIPGAGRGYMYEVSMQTRWYRDRDIALNFSFNPQGLTIKQTEDLCKAFFDSLGSDYE